MVENKNVRKLYLYSVDNKMDSSVETLFVRSFLMKCDLPCKIMKDIQELGRKPEGKRFLFKKSLWPCILERTSTL